MIGGLIGLVVAMVLAVATTQLLDLSAGAAFLVGMAFGIVCTTIGMVVAE